MSERTIGVDEQRTGSLDTAAADAVLGDVSPEDLRALVRDGATLGDAIELWQELENPEEMIDR